MQKVAIIGAGIAGLTLAKLLQGLAEVTLFEKSAGVGGRLATRYASPYEFDHGVQFFSIRTQAFLDFLTPAIQEQIIQPWHAHFVEVNQQNITQERQWSNEVPHYVATPRMNQLAKYLAPDKHLYLQTQVTSIQKGVERSWSLYDKDSTSLGEFDWVLCSAPAAQTTALLPKACNFLDDISSIKMLGCYALMLGMPEGFTLPWDAAVVKNANISWIAANHSKPGRSTMPSIIIQASNHWADAHMGEDLEAVQEQLLQTTYAVLGQDVSIAKHIAIHRWRYANIATQSGPAYYCDSKNQLAAFGDWCIKGRVESAFLSAYQLYQQLKDSLT